MRTLKHTTPTIPQVAIDWSGKFEVFFAQRNYRFISALYGSAFSGYMGVAIAYPATLYEVEHGLGLRVLRVRIVVRISFEFGSQC